MALAVSKFAKRDKWIKKTKREKGEKEKKKKKVNSKMSQAQTHG